MNRPELLAEAPRSHRRGGTTGPAGARGERRAGALLPSELWIFAAGLAAALGRGPIPVFAAAIAVALVVELVNRRRARRRYVVEAAAILLEARAAVRLDAPMCALPLAECRDAICELAPGHGGPCGLAGRARRGPAPGA